MATPIIEPIFTKSSEAEVLSQRSKLRHDRRISRVSGHLWRCISYRRGIYTFTLRDEFNPSIHFDAKERMDQVLKDLYPAIEPTPKKAMKLYNFRFYKENTLKSLVRKILLPIREWIDGIDKDHNEIRKGIRSVCKTLKDLKSHKLARKFKSIDPLLNRVKYVEALPQFSKKIESLISTILKEFFEYAHNTRKFYKQLGFSANSKNEMVTFKIPSIRKLQKRWERIQVNKPDLPQLKIYSCKGIANDLKFVEAYMSHDVMISRDKELIHDYFVHLYSVIQLIYENPESYKTKKALFVEQINDIYEKIMFAKQHLIHSNEEFKTYARSIGKLEITLGLSVDVISSYNIFKDLPEDFKFYFFYYLNGIMQNPVNAKYFLKRLDNDDVHLDRFDVRRLLNLIDLEMKKIRSAPSSSQDV